jgi:hypothetical protein
MLTFRYDAQSRTVTLFPPEDNKTLSIYPISLILIYAIWTRAIAHNSLESLLAARGPRVY